MTDQLSGGVVQPTDAQIDPLDDLHGLLFLAQRTEGDQREAAISNARIVLHKFREAMVAVPQAPLQAEPAQEVLRKVVHYGNCMATGNIMAAEAAMSAVEDALASPAPMQAEPVPVVASDSHVRAVLLSYHSNNLTEDEAVRLLATPQAEPAVAEQAREDVRDSLQELVDLMQGVIDGDYKPDSFTLQPARAGLASQSTPPPESAESRERFEKKVWPTLAVPGDYDGMDAQDQYLWRSVVEEAWRTGLAASATPPPESAGQRLSDAIKDAFEEGCTAISTYNDMPNETVEEAWERSQAKRDQAAILAANRTANHE